MKFPSFHRHHDRSSSWCPSEEADHCDIGKPLPSEPAQHNTDKEQDMMEAIAAMHQSEEGGPYDPSGKFNYHPRQYGVLEQRTDADGLFEEKANTMVDEKCRTKMLDWCSKVSYLFK